MKLRFLATDLEVGLRSKCQASIAKGGSLTLPAKKFYEIVRSLPETDIRIAEDKNGVKIAADRFESRMQTLPREDFPTLPESSGQATVTLPRDGAEGDGRQDAVCDHRRRHPVFPERRAVRAAARFDEPGRDRRPSSRARDREAGRQEREGRRGSRSRFFPRRRSASSAGCSRKARATSGSSAARTICSSRSAAGC